MRPLRVRRDYLMTLAVTLGLSNGGMAQYCLQFGGTGGTVRVEDLRLRSPIEQLGIEFWFKSSDSIRKAIYVVSRWNASDSAEDKGTFFVAFTDATSLRFGIRNEVGKVESVAARFGRRDDVWRHVAASWNGTSLAIAIDGRTFAEKQVVDFGKLAPSRLAMLIGPVAMRKSRRPAIFPGFLADISIWSKPRSSERIQKAARKPLPRNASSLVAHYRLYETSPTDAVKDSAGSGSVGQLTKVLARSGWCYTKMWTDPDPERPSLDLYCYDLHAIQNTGSPMASWRNVLVSNAKTQQVGVLWQDARSGAIQITWVEPDLTDHHTILLEASDDGILVAGTTDPVGNIYYLVIQKTPRKRVENIALQATLHKANAEGKALASKSVDMTRQAFNVWSFNSRSRGNMRFSKGVLGLILPRTMYISDDGLRHQSAIAVTFSAKTLEVKRMLGVTSGHSKGNILTLNTKGEFIGLDLGDNYPRGVHLHKFTATNKASAVVFTFKTAHGRRPRNGSPIYDAISGDSETFYKWSNDNNTYTELGGVVEARRSYSVIFSTDQSLDGKVLDNSRAVRNCHDPRNLAMVRVIKRFQKAGSGSVVRDDLMVGLPKDNRVELGGFFDFSGGWAPQRVTGVIWLTQYKANEAARSPQVIRLRDKGVLVLWRKTGPEGNSLRAMKIDKRGKLPKQAMRLDLDLEFNREDRLVRVGDRIFLLAAEAGKPSRLYFVHDDSK